jgi:isochorismate synthase
MQEVIEKDIPISGAVRICLGKNLQFAAYRLPGEQFTTLMVQKDPVPLCLSVLDKHIPDKGFLVAPFAKDKNKAWLIKPDIVIHGPVHDKDMAALNELPVNNDLSLPVEIPSDTIKEDYIRAIDDSLKQIKAGAFDKVVLSRVKSVEGNFSAHLPSIFMSLCASYPNAFVYLFSVNGQCWTGATPEPFICSHQNELKTVSLAGTRTYSERNLDITNWNSKELQEQEYVTLHIENIFKKFKISSYTKSGPYVTRAGNLLHLRTDFAFPAQSLGNRLPALIAALHPTPAVCGMSTGKAMNFIKKSEKHDREYYAGFIGPVGFTDILKLYMNLRCLKVHGTRMVLYIGGGITRDSLPEEEWLETEMKAETLMSVINQIC